MGCLKYLPKFCIDIKLSDNRVTHMRVMDRRTNLAMRLLHLTWRLNPRRSFRVRAEDSRHVSAIQNSLGLTYTKNINHLAYVQGYNQFNTLVTNFNQTAVMLCKLSQQFHKNLKVRQEFQKPSHRDRAGDPLPKDINDPRLPLNNNKCNKVHTARENNYKVQHLNNSTCTTMQMQMQKESASNSESRNTHWSTLCV